MMFGMLTDRNYYCEQCNVYLSPEDIEGFAGEYRCPRCSSLVEHFSTSDQFDAIRDRLDKLEAHYDVG